jgi:hypothetical protein
VRRTATGLGVNFALVFFFGSFMFVLTLERAAEERAAESSGVR